MLSLSPRFDLFVFKIPKDYIPQEILDKYTKVITKQAGVFFESIDYLNESIQGVTFPGMSDLIMEQPQVSTNSIIRTVPTIGGKINREPAHTNSTYTGANPIDKIKREMTVTFRQNQGLYNYFMLYETIFYRYCKPELYQNKSEQFVIELLDRTGRITSKIILDQPEISGIDDLDFSYSKIERQEDTFQITFTFNNIDFDIVPQQKEDE